MNIDENARIKKKTLNRIKKTYKEEIDLILLRVADRPENDFKEYAENVLDWTTPIEIEKEGEAIYGGQKDYK